MSMADLEQALALIAQQEDADFEDERPEAVVVAAEQALGRQFPPTYRRFVKTLGAGDIAGLEVFGVVGENLDARGLPNGIWLTRQEREISGLPEWMIVVGETGTGELYVIDTAQRDTGGESPVVIWEPGASGPGGALERVADDFGTYLLERLAEVLA